LELAEDAPHLAVDVRPLQVVPPHFALEVVIVELLADPGERGRERGRSTNAR
jgi:hypothetical protein